MYYVYLLKWQGIPFYVGMTNNPVRRYKLHYYDKSCSTYRFVRYQLFYFHKTVEIELVFCTDNETTARYTEFRTMTILGIAGFALSNARGASCNWPQMPQYPAVPPFKAKFWNLSYEKQIRDKKQIIHKYYGYE